MSATSLGKKALVLMWLYYTTHFWAWQTAGFAGLAWRFLLIAGYPEVGPKIGIYFGTVSLVLFAAASIWAFLSYHSWRVRFGEHAFEISYGVIERKSASIPYGKVQSVDIVQNLLDRIIGSGRVLIATAEATRPESVEPHLPPTDIALANRIKEEIMKRTHAVAASSQINQGSV